MVMNHKQLDLWNVSVELAVEVYQLASGYPQDEKYGLGSQTKTAVVSIASNLAEGAARGSNREFIRFLNIAAGSASELDTQFEIILRTGIGDRDAIQLAREKLQRVARMIQGLKR